jgi:hypothetical protein
VAAAVKATETQEARPHLQVKVTQAVQVAVRVLLVAVEVEALAGQVTTGLQAAQVSAATGQLQVLTARLLPELLVAQVDKMRSLILQRPQAAAADLAAA